MSLDSSNQLDLKLEENLQNIVNNLTFVLEELGIDEKAFQNFSQLFHKSETIEEIIESILALSDKLKEVYYIKKKDNIKLETLSTPNAKVCEANYESLEKVLQKYEAEIREHIRIEQQLKIYTESLEENLDELKASQSTLKLKFQSATKENQQLQTQLSRLNSLVKNKRKSYKSTKVNGFAFAQSNKKNQSIDSTSSNFWVKQKFPKQSKRKIQENLNSHCFTKKKLHSKHQKKVYINFKSIQQDLLKKKLKKTFQQSQLENFPKN